MDPEWIEQGVLDVVKLKYWSFIPRRGSGRRSEREIDPELGPARDRARARGRGAERGRADGAVRRDAARGDRGDAGRRRRAARRARRATRRPSSSTATSTSPTSASSAAPSAASARASARPTPTTSSPDDFQARIAEAVDFGATEICMQGGIHPDYTLEDYGALAAAGEGGGAAAPPARLLADGGPLHVRALRARPRTQVFDYLLECGLGSTPGTAAEVLDDGVRAADLAEQAAGRPLGRDHRGLPPRAACARPRP